MQNSDLITVDHRLRSMVCCKKRAVYYCFFVFFNGFMSGEYFIQLHLDILLHFCRCFLSYGDDAGCCRSLILLWVLSTFIIYLFRNLGVGGGGFLCVDMACDWFSVKCRLAQLWMLSILFCNLYSRHVEFISKSVVVYGEKTVAFFFLFF